MIRRSIRVVALLLTISATSSIGAMAEPIQSQADTEQAVKSAIEQQANTQVTVGEPADANNSIYNSTKVERATKIRQEMNELLEKIQGIDNEISNNEVQLQENKGKIEEIKAKIEENEEDIEEQTEEIKKNELLCGRRMQSLVTMVPQLEMIASIANSESVSDFFNKVANINKIIEQDKQVLMKVKESRDNLEKLNKQNKKDKKSLEEMIKYNENMKNELEKKKEEATVRTTSLKEEYANLFNLSDNAGAKEVQEVLQLKYSQYSFNPVTSQVDYASVIGSAPGIYESPDLSVKLNFTQDDVIMKATSLLGIPYVWGGTTLNGFDCSGFVQYVYRQFGIYLPRVSQDQQNYGVEVVDESQLQPGDLLFFGDPAHHVAMYVQPGYMMEAPYTGSVIKVSPIRAYTKAMRVVDWSKMVPQVTDTTQATTSTDTTQATTSTDTTQVTEVSTPEVQ